MKNETSTNRKRNCPIGRAFNHKGVIVKLLCGNWACPNCGKKNARLWAWRVRINIKANGETAWFWTLTLGSKFTDLKSAFSAIPSLWDRFRKIIQRETEGDFSYVAFVEGQPKRGGMPHFHIISMTKSPRRLKDIAVQAGFGFQAKESRVDGPEASSYVAKYATKAGDHFPRNLRRVRASRGWAKLPPYEGDPLLVKARTETLSTYLMRVHDICEVDLDTLYERWNYYEPDDSDNRNAPGDPVQQPIDKA